MKTIIFIGPPGCGKGTHAKRLSEKYGIVQVSVGDLLRREIKEGTETGRKVSALLREGRLVSDQIVMELVKGALSEHGGRDILFDGFPRKVSQAKMLQDVLPEFQRDVNRAVLFVVSDDEVVRRISGRRIDPETGRIYHVEFDPPPAGVKVVQRDDDREEVVKKRLEIYHRETEPVADFYRKLGRLAEVDGEGTVPEVYEQVVRALGL